MSVSTSKPRRDPAAERGPRRAGRLPKPSPELSGGMGPQSSLRMWLGGVALVLATLFTYAPTFNNGYIWDDDDYVTNNATLLSLQGLKDIWIDFEATPQYYPLVHTTYWIEYRLWGLKPTGYHVTNVLLHTLGALLLWRALRVLNVPGAWLAAAVFTLHPVHVESVAWITERKNVLSVVFYMGALLAYLRFKHLGVRTAEPAGAALSGSLSKVPGASVDVAAMVRPPWLFYGLALFLFVCALLSKTVTCSLPAALLLVLWWKRGRISLRDVVELLPFFAVGLALGLLTAWLEKSQVGARGPEWDFSHLDRVLIAGRALWFYAQKLLAPWPLVFIYPRWQIDDTIWWQYLFPLSALGLIIALWLLRRRLGRGPLVAVLFFVGTLVPALGFFDVYPMRYSFVADHFQYLGSIGIIVLLCAAGTRLVSRLGPGGRTAGTALAVLVLLTFAMLGRNQTHAYESAEALWNHTLSSNPNAWMAHNNLGNIHFHNGRHEQAIAYFKEALRLRPTLETAHSNMSLAYQGLNQWEEAERLARRAVELEPDFFQAHNSLGLSLCGMGRYEEAIESFKEAIRLYPDYIQAHINIGYAYQESGDAEKAMEQYHRVLERFPDLAMVYGNLGLLMQQEGRLDKAVQHYRRALEIEPEYANARGNLQRATYYITRLREQVPGLKAELAANPSDVRSHHHLGMAYSALGELDAAARHLQEALRLQPDHLEAQRALDNVRRWREQDAAPAKTSHSSS